MIEALRIIKNRITAHYTRSNYPRECRLYCVGSTKTGTHSIGSMFNDSVRSAHEPDTEEITEKNLDIAAGRTSNETELPLAPIRKSLPHWGP